MAEFDLDSVLEIERASFPHPWRREHFEHELASPYSFPFVALHDNKIVGYVCLMSLFEEAEILTIAVDPAERGKGFARKLMEQALSTAGKEGAEVLRLEVRVSNQAAQSLYKDLGFVRTGIRPRYYENNEDAVLMQKTL